MPRRLRPQPILLLVAALALGVLAPPAAAQDAQGSTPSTAAPERSQVDEARSRRSEVEAELGLLRRSDVQLEADLARLDAEIAQLEDRSAQAEDELADLQGELAGLRRQLTVAEDQAAEQQQRLVERAVAAYVDPRPQLGMSLLAHADLGDVGRRKVLLDAVADRDRSVLDQHLAAEASLRSVREATEASEQQAAELKASAEADLATLRDRRVQQAAVADELDDRIAHFQSESDALAAQEAELTAMINARLASAQAQAARTTTTTQAPAPSSTTTATTVAPSSSRPGGTGPGATTSTTASAPTTTRPSTTSTTTRPSGTSMRWPTNGVLTSTFGMRWGRMHQGIDIGAPIGTPITAAAAGTVFFAGEYGGYGNLILVDHGNGIVTAYAHQSGFAVTSGPVSAGQTIGYVGSTGHSTGPHLHFEVRVGGTAVDPMGYLR